MSCATCVDPDDGTPYYPLYGVAPHECYWRKGPDHTIGQSTLLPSGQWAAFVPDLSEGETWADFRYPQATGVHYCPDCRDGFDAAWTAFVAVHGLPPEYLEAA